MWSSLTRHFSSADMAADDAAPGPRHLAHAHTDPLAGVTGVYTPPHQRRTASPFRPPPLDPVVLDGHGPATPASARLLARAVAEEVRSLLPERLRIVEHWRLVYSLAQDGASLHTLYARAAAVQGARVGFVLVVRDDVGGTFGAYLSEHPRPAPGYFGNGECFLWRASALAALPPPPSADAAPARSTTIAPDLLTGEDAPAPPASPAAAAAAPPPPALRFKAFPYSGENEYCINCETGFLSMGAGDGHYGLWLDGGLARGRSGRSLTFGNEPLSDEGDKFGVLGVELWVLGA
ncbi:Oxidation resistance protein 1 like [Verticillium longisporum]|uniref:Oxidation resistance protein 1 n=1 Tax=Verticillium longisporum TaxID=100787 RepID=A0A8I3AVU5_VERLO|nr:Oxidation resistance protein 1 like [Verticillium longisporum]